MHSSQQIAGTGPGFWIRGTLHTVKSVVRAIPSSAETPERPPEIHEGHPNLAESNELDASPTQWLFWYRCKGYCNIKRGSVVAILRSGKLVKVTGSHRR
jgi:hypothetical protein